MKSLAQLRSLLKSVRQSARLAVDLAFPPCCTFCGIDLDSSSTRSRLCDACRESFCSLPGPLCPRCATPMPQIWQSTQSCQGSHFNGPASSSLASSSPASHDRPADSQRRCARCHNRHYYFASATALGVYQGTLRVAVRRMKRPAFEQLTYAVGDLLGDWVAEWAKSEPVDLVVPVPMHWTRRMWRGASTADVLAEAVARRLGVRSCPRLVCCERATKKQGMLAPAERFTNVRKAFRLTRHGMAAGARILVVDDVMTTGATASEVARVLRRARAASVRVAVVGRGVGHG